MSAIIQSVGAFNYENRFSFCLPMRKRNGELRSRGWVVSENYDNLESHRYFESLKASKYYLFNKIREA
jgi:hypothetical protein